MILEGKHEAKKRMATDKDNRALLETIRSLLYSEILWDETISESSNCYNVLWTLTVIFNLAT